MWKAAIDDELQSLNNKNTWTPDYIPTDTPLPTHILLKIKRKEDGSVELFKTRVVAGANFQTYGETTWKHIHLLFHFLWSECFFISPYV